MVVALRHAIASLTQFVRSTMQSLTIVHKTDQNKDFAEQYHTPTQQSDKKFSCFFVSFRCLKNSKADQHFLNDAGWHAEADSFSDTPQIDGFKMQEVWIGQNGQFRMSEIPEKLQSSFSQPVP